MSTTAKRGDRTFLRAAIALQTATVFVQAVSAGLLLSSSSFGMTLHSVGARVMFAAVMVHLAAAILAWRPGGGSPGPILYAAGFMVITSAQVVLGIAHVTSPHVPLGVLMFGLSLLHLGRPPAAHRARTAAAE
ncbi:hypothetical protein AB0I22_17190 [Streptomyces sp. NPDC050610]|uniref:hypothetical protein n=1 Tax=Streptomyces sp. NPDC050610 TaxID=3157097 RepID=UPI00343B4F40